MAMSRFGRTVGGLLGDARRATRTSRASRTSRRAPTPRTSPKSTVPTTGQQMPLFDMPRQTHSQPRMFDPGPRTGPTPTSGTQQTLPGMDRPKKRTARQPTLPGMDANTGKPTKTKPKDTTKSSGVRDFWNKTPTWGKVGMVGGGGFIGGNMIGGSSGRRGAPPPRSTGGMM